MNNTPNGSNDDPDQAGRNLFPSLTTPAAFAVAGLMGATATYFSRDPSIGATIFAAVLGALTRK
ncbi:MULTISPECIES: hypothetical protein [unclassified Rhodococcus (in: high G+C Gram-positive bacteria)]|uniref:hypothetical protein n=1 Tax=unclassified Rhodococcus (in: high G+C Gram-positive bacteria) TaxID=192944 RepID=UPI00113FD074|nr:MULTISPECIES: hypothetical protein [unclassified Rhodococcus (in: high G+C Gram-positive bacteria)]